MFKKVVVYFVILTIISIVYLNFKKKTNKEDLISNVDETYNSNLLENIKYVAKDNDGNEYIINAATGEIDINNI